MPRVLYKYRDFSARTTALLCRDEVYYAKPSTFNDPLDSKPCVRADCDVETLEKTVYELVRQRVEAEMRSGAQAVKYRGPKTVAHIEKHSESAAKRTIDTLRYYATDPEYVVPPPQPHIELLEREIERELLLQYDKGILSLARRYDCPLMWSHYGDQHKGVCIGYSVPADAVSQVHQVRYGGERVVLASEVAAMVEGDARARQSVDAEVLLTKARDWRYEKEWRMLGQSGTGDSPLELVEVLFGTRCEAPVMHTIASSLAGRERTVKLYEMHEVPPAPLSCAEGSLTSTSFVARILVVH